VVVRTPERFFEEDEITLRLCERGFGVLAEFPQRGSAHGSLRIYQRAVLSDGPLC